MRLQRMIPMLIALSAIACEDDVTDPDLTGLAEVAGDYTTADDFAAMSFTTVDGGVTVDWLAEGAEVSLLLAANGTTEGRLFIPATDPELAQYFEPEDLERGFFEADMAGTWSLEDGIVRLEQEADSFMRDLDFTFVDGVLSGQRTFSEVAVSVILVRG